MDFNSLWPHVWKYLGNWEIHYRICGFIVIDGDQIANFETKTKSLISKFDSKFVNFTSKLEKQLWGWRVPKKMEVIKAGYRLSKF